MRPVRPRADARRRVGHPQFGLRHQPLHVPVHGVEPEPGPSGTNGTAVARADLECRLDRDRRIVTIIFSRCLRRSSQGHYGSSPDLFGPDGTLLRHAGRAAVHPAAERRSLSSQLGKVVRINRRRIDPCQQPYAASSDVTARASGATVTAIRRPPRCIRRLASLWVTEHGPHGGDEVNLAARRSQLRLAQRLLRLQLRRSGGTRRCRIGGGVHNAPYTAPLAFWYPTSTAPGGCDVLHRVTRFPEWQGNFLVGGLAGRTLYRLVLNPARPSAVIGQAAPSLPACTRSAISEAGPRRLDLHDQPQHEPDLPHRAGQARPALRRPQAKPTLAQTRASVTPAFRFLPHTRNCSCRRML